jgi:GNAT superfamily N-acetyltransferase
MTDLRNLADLRMKQEHLDEVKALYARCHPTWPARSDWWWRYMNTLVITSNYRVIAYSCMSFAPPPGGDRLPADALAAYLIDTGVAPEARGQGLAGILMDRRLDVAYAVGAQMAIGAANRKNKPMVALLDARGFVLAMRDGTRYPGNETGDVYILHLGGRDVTF